MVYKKYTYKNGKKFGPYYYETKRINGKVITKYLGSKHPKKNKNLVLPIAFFSLIGVLLLLFFYFSGLTGNVSLDIKSNYNYGEKITGNLIFNLKSGELIPLDSTVVVSYGGETKEFLLSELVNQGDVGGTFYAEGKNINGSGRGYGIIGERKIYPEISFDLLVFDDENLGNNDDQSNLSVSGNESKDKLGENFNVNEFVVDNNSIEKSGDFVNSSEKNNEPSNSEDNRSNNSNEKSSVDKSSDSSGNNSGNQGNVEDNSQNIGGNNNVGENVNQDNNNLEKSSNDNSQKQNQDFDNKDSTDSGNSENSGGNSESSSDNSGSSNSESSSNSNDNPGNSESSGDGGSGKGSGSESSESSSDNSGNSESSGDSNGKVSSSDGSSGITGGVVSVDSYDNTISGVVVSGNDFEYVLPEGKTAKLVSGSVEVDGDVIDDGDVNLKIKKSKAVVSTVYFVDEKGFGEEYLGDNVLELNINLDKFDFVAENNSNFAVLLVYNNETLVSVDKDISVDENKSEIIKDTFNETIDNETIGNVTIINQTNVTVVDVSVNTTQFGAILGKPVKWKKRVDARGPVNITVEIPVDAKNVSVAKIVIEGNESENNKQSLGVDDKNINSNDSTINKDEGLAGNNSVEKANNEKKIEKVKNDSLKNKEIAINLDGGITGKVSADLEFSKEFILAKWFKKFFKFTGFAVSENNKNSKDVVVSLNESEKAVEIEYETPAPYSEEIEMGNGKRVKIVGPDNIHYQNVLAFTNLSESLDIKNINEIKIYWRENNSYVPVLNLSDKNNNGIYDYVEWVAPHLSNQTFDIIKITKAEHLDSNRSFISDIYEDVKELDGNWSEPINDSEYVRVTFERNLTEKNDITIYPRTVSGNPKIEVYEFNQSVKIAEFSSLKDNEYNKIYLDGSSGVGLGNKTPDVFDLLIKGGSVEFDYIVDPSGAPNVDFVSPTPSSGSTQASTGIYANLSSSDVSDHYSFVDFNNDLAFWMRMDDVNGSGDPTDISSYSNNGSLNGVTISSTYGHIGNGSFFDGVSYITGVDANSLDFGAGNDFSGCFWMNTTQGTSKVVIFSKRYGSNNGWRFYQNKNMIELQLDDGGVASYDSNVLLSSDLKVWRHICIVVDRSANVDFYKDGSSIGSALITAHSGSLSNTAKYFIGINPSTGAQYFQGNLDEFLIFNRTLTSTEVLAIYNASANQYQHNFTGLVNGTYNFTGYAVDISGNKNETNEYTVTVNTSYVPDTTPPGVTIISPQNTTYSTSDLPLVFNVTLDETGSVQYSLDGGATNITMTSTDGLNFNASNSSIAGGSYTFQVYANDTAGNNNYTESVVFSFGDTNVWISNSAQLFTNASAWSLGSVPVAGDDIVLNGTGIGNMNITNNTLPQNLGSFTVDSGYTGTVNFEPLFAVGSWGSYQGTQEWNVTNNINISGGTMYIYGAGSNYVGVMKNKTIDGEGQIWHSLSGNISIGSLGVLDGVGLGFATGAGPGGSSGGTNHGGSYGGRGHGATFDAIYGNATAPTSLGSGGENTPGGSGIKLETTDKISVDGIIRVSGSTTTIRAGAGGSIWLKADKIEGSGTLNADGAVINIDGGGGRIRLGYGSAMNFTGTISVAPGEGISGITTATSGTLTFTNNTWPGDWNLTGDVGLLGGNYGEGDVINVLGNFNSKNYDFTVYGDCFGNSGTPKAFVCYNTTSDGKGVWINASGNITIGSGRLKGSIFGFPTNVGPGTGAGASYGGLGFQGITYGNETQPISLGSGCSNSGNGGSAIKLESPDRIIFDGFANFYPSLTPGALACASGGSIWLKSNNITGNGTLFSSGGTTNTWGGGGGRIALTSSGTIDFSGNITNGGGHDTSGTAQGSGGTIYINATNSINLPGNISVYGWNAGGTINIADSLLTLSGIYNATGDVSDGTITTNYTSCSSTFTGSFDPTRIDNGPGCDTTPPNVTIVSPQNTTYNIDNLPLIFNVTLSESGSVQYSLDGGATNITMTSTDGLNFNASNSSIAGGSYTFQVYANDTAGNNNYTESVVFSYEGKNISSCRYLNSTGVTYTIINALTSSGSCLNVTASDISIEGNNYLINNSAGTLGTYGISVSSVNNTLINNVTVSNFDYNIYLFNNSYTNYIDNSTILSGKSAGIYAYSANDTTVVNSNISNNVLGFYSTAETYITTVNFSNNVLYDNGGDAASFISAQADVKGNEIVNVVGKGIYVKTVTSVGSANASVFNNVVDSTSGMGIDCYSDSNYCYFINNTVRHVAGSSAMKLRGVGSIAQENNISDNSGNGLSIGQGSTSLGEIKNNYLSNNSVGISLSSGVTAKTIKNIIFDNNTLDSNDYGLYLTSSSFLIENNTFQNFVINNSRKDAIYLVGAFVDNINFVNMTISNTNPSYYDLNSVTSGINGLAFVDSYIGNYTFAGSLARFEDITNGEINFLELINGSGTNLTNDVRIGTNSAIVESSVNSGLNKSANVTFYNMLSSTFLNPSIFRDGVECNSGTNPACYNFTSLNAVTVMFNVSSWTNYTVGESYNVDKCMTLRVSGKTYNLVANITPSGSANCIQFGASNIDFECGGNWIANSTFGAVNIYANRIGSKVNNCNVTSHSVTGTGVKFDTGADNGFIWNTETHNSGRGIDVRSNNVEIINNTLNNNGNSGFNLQDANNLTVNGNHLESTQLSLSSVSNSTFDDNGINGSANPALYFGPSSPDNVFSNIQINNTNGANALEFSITAGGSDRNNFTNVTVFGTVGTNLDFKVRTEINDTYLIDSYFEDYDIASPSLIYFKDSANGEIKFLGPINGSGTNLSNDIRIENNSVTVESSVNSGLNKSANITLYNLPTFSRPLILKDGQSCGNSCYNFTSLNAGTVMFNITSWTNYSIGAANNAPNTPTPMLSSTDGSNQTAQNLHGTDILVDPDGDLMNVSVRWYKNDVLNLSIDYNNSYANNYVFTADLSSGNTTKGDVWIFSMRIFDGLDYTTWVNSSSLTILNTPPTVPVLSSPADGSSTTDRTPVFTWIASSDDDLDSLTYQLNLTCHNTAGGGCSSNGNDDRYVVDIAGTSYEIVGDLQYLYDNNYYYNWSMMANDSTDVSAWGAGRVLNISALIQMFLPDSSVQFGNIKFQGSNDTTDNSPLPFLLQNDGNVFVNVTIDATNLWNTINNPSVYYKYKVDNYTPENNSFNLGLSKTTFTNMPLTGTSSDLFLVELNYTNATDTAETDIYVAVPPDEGSSVRSSTVTFAGSLAE